MVLAMVDRSASDGNATGSRPRIAQIAPTETAGGHPTATARRLVDASVNANTRRSYAGAHRL